MVSNLPQKRPAEYENSKSTEHSEGMNTLRQNLQNILPQLQSLPEKKAGSQYEIISRVAYLIGVPKSIFEKEHEPPKIEIYRDLDKDKRARIIRNLCMLRTELETHFLKICQILQRQGRSLIGVPEYLSLDAMQQLSEDGIDIYKHLHAPSKFLVNINQNIMNRINNCQTFFPDWINWSYLSKIFIMPNGLSEEGMKKDAQIYYLNYNFYPYQQYINWPAENQGNILYNDKIFVTLLYQWNGDEFHDLSYVSDVSEYTKENIYEFIENSEKTVFVVDCENSDPYALCTAIQHLEPNRLEKIEKIILYDDVNAAIAWEMLSSYINIPIEYEMIERLKANKSLADIKVAVGTCKEFYENGVDSFVLVSSDSDYWGLIEAMPKAKFLVMVEHSKCSFALKNALISKNIFYCYIDSFYAGDGNEMKQDALKRVFADTFKDALDLNLNELMEQALYRTRITMTEEEKKRFLQRQIKRNLSLEIDNEGNVRLDYH